MPRDRIIGCTAGLVFLFLGTGSAALGAEAKLTLYVPFNGSINAQVAAGKAKGLFLDRGAVKKPRFAAGIKGKGLLTGRIGQVVRFAAKGNLPTGQWTISFWVRGLKGADWHSRHLHGAHWHQEFWQLFGKKGAATRFYKYASRGRPWLLSSPVKGQGKSQAVFVPNVPESQWHYWAVTWRQGAGAFIYLDGHQVARDDGFQATRGVSWIDIGQRFGLDKENKVIDEFKIYNAALGAGAIARHYRQEGDFATAPIVTVGPTDQKISIDGKIQPGEWRDAVEITGLIGKKRWTVDSVPTHFWLTHDKKNLYFAMHSAMPPEVKNTPETTVLHGFLQSQAVAHDTLVNRDDSFALHVIPDFPHGERYLFYANGIGTTYEYALSKKNKADLRWDPASRVQSTVDMDGWSMEVAIPIRAFGVEAIKDGQTWRMNLGRIWKMLRERADQWAAGRRIGDEAEAYGSGMGTVRFVAQPAAVVQLRKFVLRSDAKTRFVVHLRNPGKGPQSLSVSLAADGKLRQRQTLTLGPGQSETVTIDKDLKRDAGRLISLRVATAKGKTLFYQAAPLIVQRVTRIALWSYPSRQQLRLGWLLQAQNVEPGDLSLEVRIKDEKGRTVATRQLKRLPSIHGSVLMDVKGLSPGDYHVDVQLADKNAVLQHEQLTFNKKPLPKWLGNTLGISATPPPPWTAVKVSGDADSISVWGRTYRYGGALLPQQIDNRGKRMLAAPMRLTVDARTARKAAPSAVRVQWVGKTPVRASSIRWQTIGPVIAKANSYTEFDGMTWLKLTVSPRHKRAEIRRLTFTIPLKAAWAKLINTYDYSLRQTGRLPEDGWRGKARPVWVGNGNGGIQVFQQTAATWIGSQQIEVSHASGGRVDIRLHLIDQETTLDKPITFAFGWIASPVKPAPADHRDWRIINGYMIPLRKGTGVRGRYIKQAARLNGDIRPYHLWWQGWWWVPHAKTFKGNYDRTGFLPIPGPRALARKSLVKIAGGATLISAAYGRMQQIGSANPYFAQFGDEWLPDVNGVYQPDVSQKPALRQVAVSQAARSLRDFYAWGFNKAIKKMNLHALYFDVSKPLDDNNIYHGAGVERAGAPPAPIYNILGTRKVFMRIYTLLKQHDPHARIFYHMSGQVLLPIDSFSDAMVDGENYTSQLNRKDHRGYEQVLKLDQFRAEYSAQNNFGPVTVFLPEFSRSGAIKANEWKKLGYGHAQYIMGLVLLHDSSIWWAYFPTNVLAQVYHQLDKVGWNAKWRFVGYWQQTAATLPTGLVASFYVSPQGNRVVMVLMNTTGAGRTVTVRIDPGKLGIQGALTRCEPLYPKTPISFSQSRIDDLHVPGDNFRLLMLSR